MSPQASIVTKRSIHVSPPHTPQGLINERRPPLWGSTRLGIMFLLFSSTFVCYLDRTNIRYILISSLLSASAPCSIAILSMSETLHWTSDEQGFVLSAFFWGYITTQVLGGWLSERYGGMRVLGTGLLLRCHHHDEPHSAQPC